MMRRGPVFQTSVIADDRCNNSVDRATSKLRSLPIQEIAEIVSGVGFPKEMQGRPSGDVPVFKVGDISAAWLAGRKSVTSSPNYVSHEQAKKLKAKILPVGTVVFAKIGEALRLNRRVVLGRPAIVDNNVMGLIPRDDVIDGSFLFYFMQTVHLGELSRATAVPSVRKSDVAEIPVPLTSVEQQRHIVAEIEKQFSRLDEAVANLKRVKANLKRYQGAILKAAVEGRLVPTEAELARREGRSYETGEQLVARIQAERRAVWDKNSTSGHKKFPEPPPPDASVLPDLPEGWAWIRLDTIASLKGGITVDRNRRDPTARLVPYLRVANVQRGYLDLGDVKQIEAPEADIEDLRLKSGDILFTEGGDRDKLGRGWVWENQLTECIHQNHVFRARLFLEAVSPKLVSWWGNSFGQTYFRREGKQTTNLASINLTKLSTFPIPLPPIKEQRRIVAETERRFSMADESEAQIEAGLRRAEGLRRATLKRAFEGKLG